MGPGGTNGDSGTTSYPTFDGNVSAPDAAPPIDATTADAHPEAGGIPDAGPELDAGPVIDATPPLDAAVQDAAAPDDADNGSQGDVDAPPVVLFPQLRNLSFELTSGEYGPLVINGPTRIDPWESCQPINFGDLVDGNVVEPSRGEVVPKEGEAYVAMNFFLWRPVAIRQQLAEPLQAGQTYAFAMDVRIDTTSPNDTPAPLNIYGSNASCTPQEQLSQIGSFTSDWTEVCVTITPSQTYQEILFRLGAIGDDPRLFVYDTIFIDNIHQSDTCR